MADDDDKTLGPDESDEPINPDPLGIIGWKIGGKYIVRSYIGGGGFGEVYEGYNANLPDQRLVFKFFKRVQQRSKFDKEARILCLLDHPNISRVIDYLPDEGAVVVAHIDGKDGKEVLKESGSVDDRTFKQVARSLSDAIAYAHEKNIAHRDLKPGNVMFDTSGHVYLIDFGIAKEVGDVATRTAYQALTPMFAAPERQEGTSDYDPFLSDIFEAGVTLYNFATNDLPYRNPANPNYTEWGGQASGKFSPELRRILMKATHPDPHQRYQKARELAEEMKNLKVAYGGPDDVTDKGGKKRSWLIPVLAIITVLIVGGFLGRNQIEQYMNESGILGGTSAETDEPDVKAAIDSILYPDTGSAPDSNAALALDDSAVIDSNQTIVDSILKDQEISGPDETISAINTTPKEPVKDKTPPKPTKFELTLDVVPTGVSFITVNNDSASVYDKFKLKPGDYTVKIYHREFPIYTEEVVLKNQPHKVYADMSSLFGASESADLQIALSPPSNSHMIELSFNGKGHTLLEFPVFDLTKLEGWWLVKGSIIALQDNTGRPKIDSLVIFPYGSGDHFRIKGDHGELKLKTESGQSSTIPLLIYWSE